MLDLARDSAWNFVAVMLALMALIAPLVRRNRKTLSYEIISQSTLSTVKKGVREFIQVLFYNQPVGNVELLLLKIVNNGGIHIPPNDYYGPITIQFNNSRLLAAQVDATYPENIPASIQVFGSSEGVKDTPNVLENAIEIAPVMLNPKDYIIIAAWLSDYDGELKVYGRIAGISQIHKLVKPKLNLFELAITALLASYVLTFMMHKGIVLYNNPDQRIWGVVVTALSCLPYWSLIISLFLTKKALRGNLLLAVIMTIVNFGLEYFS